MRKFVATLFCLLTGVAFAQSPAPRHTVTATNGVVVCVSPPSADAGLEILKKSGNAVDAAVAVGLSMAVTWPEAGNIGGGGFFHLWPGNGKDPVVYDYRELAPAASTPTMFVDRNADAYTHLAAGVPGTVRGLALAHATHGKLPWKDVVEPAVKQASEGFVVTAGLASRMNGVLAEARTTNAEFIRCYGKNGTKTVKWQAGDVMKLPDLAKTLVAIRDHGPDGFYKGDTARLTAEEMKRGNGIMTEADLANYVAKVRVPLKTTYRGHEVYSPPAPSGGGVTVIEVLNILESFDLKKHDRFAVETIHLMSEAARRAFADRAKYVGDPDVVNVPAFLTTKEHAKKRAATIDVAKASPSATLPDSVPLTGPDESESTTHFSVIDKNGMAVANTYTLENSFGNRIVVKGAGYLLNNEMTDFNIRPGVTNRQGTIGTEPNRIAPGKRMVSSMCPTFVAKDGKLLLVTGSPGGRTIPNTVLNVVVSVVDYGMDARAAVDGRRTHHQWFPDRIVMEGLKDRATVAERLKAMGHTVSGSRQGDAHTIVIDPKTGAFHGAADPRLDGKAVGY